ncbi:MAG: ABC transporter ATP-binding protein [Planctomycetia bacterium]|nr:ABC transporter ATP-binding protein [Planctomycetia bacterium]
MIEASALTKIYGEFAAASDISFRIRKGEIVCFLGPNGAGKSTTMKLLTGFLAPTSGYAKIAGFNMLSERIEGAKHLGYLPENGPLYPDMSPLDLLKFFAQIRRIPVPDRENAIERVVGICDLESVLKKPIGQLSRGFRQRVGMAHALLHEPDVLILDEPTAGLDPNQIHQVRETIKKIGEKKTILLSTHILQEVGAVASRILFINEGHLIFDGAVRDFGSSPEDFDAHFRELTRSV